MNNEIIIKLQQELINLYEQQIMDLTMMSKIELGDGVPWYQNKRCSALFKDGEDGKPYYIDAIVKRDQKGICWSGMAWLSEEDYKSGDRSKMVGKRGYVKSFPFIPKTFYIDVRDVEAAKDDWESFVVDPAQLDEVWGYYDKE